MKRLDELGYRVVVDGDIADSVAAFVRERGFRHVVCLCDRAVIARATHIARAIGPRTRVIPFALGERRKTLGTLGRVLDTLAGEKLDRESLLVGVGGGVAADLFGLAAALYMRGIAFSPVATTLIAMVDAAIGGKTAVDLAAGKNLAGAFRDPVAVFCDIGSLATLPDARLIEGLAEVVKHGVIEGGDAFEILEEHASKPLRRWPWETIVAESIAIKAMVVRDDRLEAGAREILNLGHTFAHAIEQLSAYRTPHGSAVAIGLRGAGLLAMRTGRFSRAEHLRVLSLLALLQLPLVAPYGSEQMLAAMQSDKKARGGALRFVVPRKIGDVEYGLQAPKVTVRAVLRTLAQLPGPRELR